MDFFSQSNLDSIIWLWLWHRISTSKLNLTDTCRTVPCQYHAWGMPGRQTGSPIAENARVQCREPKTGPQKVQFYCNDTWMLKKFRTCKGAGWYSKTILKYSAIIYAKIKKTTCCPLNVGAGSHFTKEILFNRQDDFLNSEIFWVLFIYVIYYKYAPSFFLI